MATARSAEDVTQLELAQRIVDIASDRQAQDIILLDIREIASFADYFVICSGTSERQIKAVVDTVVETLQKDGFYPVQTEGAPSSGWVLIDYGSVIVHVFAPEEREYYRLERLWGEAPTIVRVQ